MGEHNDFTPYIVDAETGKVYPFKIAELTETICDGDFEAYDFPSEVSLTMTGRFQSFLPHNRKRHIRWRLIFEAFRRYRGYGQ